VEQSVVCSSEHDPCISGVCNPANGCDAVACDGEALLLLDYADDGDPHVLTRPALALFPDRRAVVVAQHGWEGQEPPLSQDLALFLYDLDQSPQLTDLNAESPAYLNHLSINAVVSSLDEEHHEVNPAVATLPGGVQFALVYTVWFDDAPKVCQILGLRMIAPATKDAWGWMGSGSAEGLLVKELACDGPKGSDAVPAPELAVHPYGQPIVAYDGVFDSEPEIRVVALPASPDPWPEASSAADHLAVSHAWDGNPAPEDRYEREPAIALLGETRGVVVWETSYHPYDAAGSAIVVRPFQIVIGNPQTTLVLSLIDGEDVLLVNDGTANPLQHPSVLALGPDRFVVAWTSTVVPGSLQAEVRVREMSLDPVAPKGPSFVVQGATSPYPIRGVLAPSIPGQYALLTEHATAPVGGHAEIRYNQLSVGGLALEWSVPVSSTTATEQHRRPTGTCQATGFCVFGWEAWHTVGDYSDWAVRLRRW
jgi:hypothetical protein